MRTPLLDILCLVAAGAGARPMQAQPTVWAHLDSARHLLTPAAFPALPVVVRRDLTRRGCRVPQASPPDVVAAVAQRPNNVVRGAFTAPGARDWAVLCSIAGVSRILVYHNGGTASIDSLGTVTDGVHVGREPGHAWAYYRVLSVASMRFIRGAARAFDGPVPPARLDHAGIEDAFAGKASGVYYFYRGRWLTLQGMD